MINHNKPMLSTKLIEAIGNPIFPELDTQLRAGKHICTEDLEKHSFIHEYFKELDSFYRRYNVELVCAPEEFYYLRTKSTSIIASSQLTELEMLAGKVLCLLYLSPEKLAQAGVFSVQEVYDELTSLVEVERLVKIINPRSTGSDIDKAKLMEKLRSALNRLARMGMITYFGKDKKDRNKFLIHSSCFRFGADVRTGEDTRTAQLKLIQSGEAVTEESLAQAKKAQAEGINPDANSTLTTDSNSNQASALEPTNSSSESIPSESEDTAKESETTSLFPADDNLASESNYSNESSDEELEEDDEDEDEDYDDEFSDEFDDEFDEDDWDYDEDDK